MGSVGKGPAAPAPSNPIKERALQDEREYKSGTNDVDFEGTMLNAYFKGAGDLLSTINRAESGRFDILNRNTSSVGGSILYTDSYSDDGVAYEVFYQKSYANPNNPSEVVVYRFERYEEGEW